MRQGPLVGRIASLSLVFAIAAGLGRQLLTGFPGRLISSGVMRRELEAPHRYIPQTGCFACLADLRKIRDRHVAFGFRLKITKWPSAVPVASM